MSSLITFVSSFLVTTWMTQVSLCSREQIKRVIDGVPFNGRPTVYSVIRYYGAIGTLHGKGFFGHEYGDVSCSGSLLAPMIFQTACHCIATFDSKSQESFQPGRLENHWETRKMVYVGVSNQYGQQSMVTYNAIMSESYVIHSKCGVLGPTEFRISTYDYAVIRLDARWLIANIRYRYPWTEISWAPHYTKQDIADFHKYALEKQLVCMHIGFGAVSLQSEFVSDVLRHGWASLLPQHYCIRFSARVKWKELSERDIAQYMSWVCTANFPKHDQDTGRSDSGSPLTCDNRYNGLLSGGIAGPVIEATSRFYGLKYEHISLFQALLHNPYVNAIEYRFSLIHQLYLNVTSYGNPPR